MVDEDIQTVASGPAGAPVNRDARRDPEVIEGEVAERSEGKGGPKPNPTPTAGSREAPAATPIRVAPRVIAAGALGGLIVAALAIGAGYSLLSPNADLAAEDAKRISALEGAAQNDSAAMQSEAKRQAAAIASLDKRVGALEAANAENAQKIAAATEAARQLMAHEADLRPEVDAARGELRGLGDRVKKLEADASPASGGGQDVSGLTARIDKIEAALAAPKSETRAAPEKPSFADNAGAIAIVAAATKDRLVAGGPLEPELAALQRLGVDPAGLAPLQTVVNGAPTGAALAASFEAIAPKVSAATSHDERGGVVDRFLAHIHGLVRVRDLNETPGDDPEALVSQIVADSRRGDIAGALGAFAKLPEPARQAAEGWATQARATQAADAAVQAIRDAAIGRLSGGAKP